MFLGIQTVYFGEVDIEVWEYSLMLAYLAILYAYFARIKNVRIKKEPEYKYFLFGLSAKIAGAIFFSLVYFYYYKGGDTISYFYSASSLANLAKEDFSVYLKVLFGPNTIEMRQYFTPDTGYPYYFIYYDSRAYMVARIISVIILFTFNSYLVATVVLSSISYMGAFKFYQTLVRYYPSLTAPLAIAVLFMPSSIFWGSSILKDTFTFSAVCWYLHSIDNLAFRKKEGLFSILAVVVSLTLIITIKPYIFLVLMPSTMAWLSYNRIARIKSTLIRYVFFPVLVAGLLGASFYILVSLEGYLDKFSLDQALQTITTTQLDMRRVEAYGDGFFDLGEFDGTWAGLLSKSHIATIAGLFRPFLWECQNFVMAIAGLENFAVLMFCLLTLAKGQVFNTLKLFTRNPLLLNFLLFSVVYAFVIGISTPNFGALVRFKIPLIPQFVSALVIANFILNDRRDTLKRGLKFDYRKYINGEPKKIPKR